MGPASSAKRARKKKARGRPGTAAPVEVVEKDGEPGDGPSRFERKFREIVEYATAVFYDKGYEGASMRDLSRASGMSLAGLYYYFESKEKLLYLIQRHTFRTVIERLHDRLQGVAGPENRVRMFIENHLEYFLANMKAMKVLSHEAAVLRNGYGAEILAIKREYYEICRELLQDLEFPGGVKPSLNGNTSTGTKSADGASRASDLRLDVLSLFGMMNWIYTWYNPHVDGDAARIARRVGDIFLSGALNRAGPPAAESSRAKNKIGNGVNGKS